MIKIASDVKIGGNKIFYTNYYSVNLTFTEGNKKVINQNHQKTPRSVYTVEYLPLYNLYNKEDNTNHNKNSGISK